MENSITIQQPMAIVLSKDVVYVREDCLRQSIEATLKHWGIAKNWTYRLEQDFLDEIFERVTS